MNLLRCVILIIYILKFNIGKKYITPMENASLYV